MIDWTEHRRLPRIAVRKPVKIIIKNSVLHCTIIDENSSGLRIHTDAPVAFPTQVVVELQSGQRWNAVTRWQKGLEAGLKYESFLGLNEQGRRSASFLLDQVQRLDVQGLLRELDEQHCFGQDQLRAAAMSFSQSVQTLENLLSRLSDRAHSRTH